MTTTPKVSVIIPVYNADKYVGESIQSVLKQDYPNIEIIVIDDCSTDNSFEYISKYEDRAKIYKADKNLKECIICNWGYRIASGDYLIRLTGDDAFINPHLISEQVETMERYQLDWCYNNINTFGKSIENSTEVYTSWMPLPLRFSPRWFWIFDNIILKFPNICYLMISIRNPINTNSFMVRASSYKKYLSWNNEFGTYCDHSLYMKLFLNRLKGCAIHSIGSFWRVHENQNTQSKYGKIVLHQLRMDMYLNKQQFPIWMKIICAFLKFRESLYNE